MKDLNYKRVIAYANYLVLFVDDKDKQSKIVAKLNEYNDQLPDGKLIDKLQKRYLSKKTDYFEIAEFILKDIEKTKNKDKYLPTIQQLLKDIEDIINPKDTTIKIERSPAKKISDLSSWS